MNENGITKEEIADIIREEEMDAYYEEEEERRTDWQMAQYRCPWNWSDFI